MKNNGGYIYTKDTEVLQISYAQYTQLMRREEETRELKQVSILTLANLRDLLVSLEGKEGEKDASSVTETPVSSQPVSSQEKPEPAPPPSAEKPAPPPPAEEPAPAPAAPEEQPAAPVEQKPKKATPKAKIPPIKKEIALHFSKKDGSGRLFDVFKEYYAALNDMCGGMMRVTMKDGICSLWNYDEWEEFAFVDLFEKQLRVAVSPKYADELKSLTSCDVPRLLARRRKLIGVLIDGMDEGLLGVLEKAFNEAGAEAK